MTTYEDFDVVARAFRGNPKVFEEANHFDVPLTADRLVKGVPVRRTLAIRSEIEKGKSKQVEGWISYVKPIPTISEEDGIYEDHNYHHQGERFCITLTTESREWLLRHVPSLFVSKNERQKAEILDRFSGKAIFDTTEVHHFIEHKGSKDKNLVTGVIGGSAVFNTRLENYVEVVPIEAIDAEKSLIWRGLDNGKERFKQRFPLTAKVGAMTLTLGAVAYFVLSEALDAKLRRDKEREARKLYKKNVPHTSD